MSYAEMIVSAGIVVLVLFAIWRVAQLNPFGTGRLARRINMVEHKVAELAGRMDGVERSILTIADDVNSISTQVSATRLELAADRGLTERTWQAVSRLEGFFIEDSFKKGRA